MLDPEYLNSLPEPLLALYDELEDWIIGDIARRLKKNGEVTATAEHQTEILRALDLTQNEINKKIAETLNKSEKEIERLFDEAFERSQNFMEERLPSLQTDGSFKKELLDNAITVSEGNLRNLTRTAGFITKYGKYSPLTTSYRDALSLASLQVSTGATDYNTAIRNALKPFTDKGIVSITYDKDGKIRRRSIEAAVRQCVMQGARDMSKAYMESVAGEIGSDGWEISAHLNCAPDHQDCQGKQYSAEKYEELNASLARPIGTLNCRHMAFPIILGVSEPAHSEQELQDLKSENDKGVTYEGKHYTLYEASQQQRKLERSIRKTKRQLIVADELSDKDDFTAQSIRLRRLREYYNDFSNKCKLTKREDLLSVGGYGKKISGKAVAAEKKVNKYNFKYIKGKHSREDDLKATNPNYATRKIEWQTNCQRCVSAYEARRRGYDVEAKPRILSKSDRLPYMYDRKKGWTAVYENGYNELKSCKAFRKQKVKTKVENLMSSYGDGARAIVRVQWKGKGGHVFITEQVNGKTIFIDPQTGDMNVERYFDDIKPTKTYILRIDNLEFTDLVKECCENK